jgi:hypothetical protein
MPLIAAIFTLIGRFIGKLLTMATASRRAALDLRPATRRP